MLKYDILLQGFLSRAAQILEKHASKSGLPAVSTKFKSVFDKAATEMGNSTPEYHNDIHIAESYLEELESVLGKQEDL